VAFESAVDREFDYGVPDEIWPVEAGQRVEAPFGRKNKPETGFCIAADIPLGESFARRDKGHRLKRITKIVDAEPLLHGRLMALAEWISSYYVCPLGQVLAAMVPGGESVLWMSAE
jgi:primosomal protein N' (replication factor Y)